MVSVFGGSKSINLSIGDFDTLIKYNNPKANVHVRDRVRLFNWFEVDINKKQKFLVCKAKSLDSDKILYFYFRQYNYYLCPKESFGKFKAIKNFIDTYKIGTYELLKDVEEIESKGISKIVSFDELISSKYNGCDDEIILKDIYLIKCIQTIKVEELEPIEQSYVQRLFYVLNDINLSTSYELDINLSLFQDTEGHYFVNDSIIPNLFKNKINVEATSITTLSFDIECVSHGAFPTPQKNEISHVGYIIKKENSEGIWKSKHFCLISSDIIEDFDPNDMDKDSEFIEAVLDCDMDEILFSDSIYKFMTEYNLLLLTKYLLEHNSVDYILTYNGNSFDIPYINGRLAFYKLDPIGSNNIIKYVPLSITEKNMSYSGKNDSYHQIRNHSGIIHYDIYNYVKNSYNIDSYSLNFFSQLIFNKKVELTHENGLIRVSPIEDKNKILTEIFYRVIRTASYCFIDNDPYIIIDKSEIISDPKLVFDEESIKNGLNKPFYIVPYNSNGVISKKKIVSLSLSKDAIEIFSKDAYDDYSISKSINYAKYCIHDSILPLYIFEKECIHFRISASSNNFLLPQALSFLYKNSTNCLGDLTRELWESRKYIKKAKVIDYGGFEGGRVFEPKKKYNSDPVLCLDFQSLYPNIFILHNLSPENVVLVFRTTNPYERHIATSIIEERYQPPSFDICKIEKEDSVLIIVFDKRRKGVIPSILRKGLNNRLIYKRLLKENKGNAVLSQLYDSMQYVTKININSIYGLSGSEYFIFSCKFCAQACTQFGREKLQFIHDATHNSIIRDGKWFVNPIKHIYWNKTIEKSYDLSLDKNTELYHKEIKPIVVYGDTDSTMVSFQCTIPESVILGERVIEIMNKELLAETILFEFEAIYCKMIILSKKRYTCKKVEVEDGNKCVDDETLDRNSKVLNKGISLARRDYNKIHKYNIRSLINYIDELLTKGDLDNIDDKLLDIISEFIIKQMVLLDKGELDLSQYLITMKYNDHTKNADYYIHSKVQEYNNSPLKTTTIEGGDRFTFLYIVPYEYNKEEDDIRKRIGWDKNIAKDGVQGRLYVVDADNIIIPKGYRLALEVYISRYLNDATSYFTRPESIKRLTNIYL